MHKLGSIQKNETSEILYDFDIQKRIIQSQLKARLSLN